MPQDSGAVRERDLVLPADEQGISDANVIYRHVTAGGLNELDKIARFILAVAFSGEFPGNDREQHFVAQRTVAVARHQGKIYVASNGLYGLAPSDGQRGNVATALAGAGIADEIVYLANWALTNGGGNEYHAEIQLMDYFYFMRLPLPQIGVSKPCCGNCSTALTRVGTDHSYFHTQGTGQTQLPRAGAKWW